MNSFSRFLSYLFLILDVSTYLEVANTFFLQTHEHQSVFRERRDVRRNRTACILPSQPEFGSWTFLEDEQKRIILEFFCDDGYILSGQFKYMVCTQHGWIPSLPRTCYKKCPPLHSTDEIIVTCENNGVVVRCDEATDNTTASFECGQYFEPEDRMAKNRSCWKGKWLESPPKCQPVCGEKRVSATPLIANGTKVQKRDYPWSTAIYLIKDNEEEYTCAGSVLTQTVILTAAHCVSDEYGTPTPEKNILVGVGKYYNKYKDPRETEAQYSKVSKVVAHEDYMGDRQRFRNDIALLITQDKLLLSRVVQPVCYQGLTKFFYTEGFRGVITSWGSTTGDGNPSDELLEVQMTYSSVCQTKDPPDAFAEKYFTPDKFCGKYYNKGTALCAGDSGAGTVFEYYANRRYYIGGVVSIGEYTHSRCITEGKIFFTDVVKHYQWLQENIQKQNTL